MSNLNKNQNSFVGIVPVRKRSKSIRNKNLILINKKPLVEYTFKEIAKSKLKKSFVLTDSEKIKKIALKYKINTDYIRPSKVSKDTTSTAETLIHFLKDKKIDNNFDYLVILQATSPLRSYKDINNAIEEFKKKKLTSLTSISESLEHPYQALEIDKKKKSWKYILPKGQKFTRRQDYDIDSYFINGAIFIVSRKYLENKLKTKSSNHGFYYMPKSRALDLNDHEDLKMIKKLIKVNK
jgi:CMP-N,N'-diacetyllegionaminic acid synthase